jgi:nitrous oxidase accessory protein NosD
VARALTAASPGDRICITADLPSFRVAITRGGDTAEPVTVVGDGQTVVGGITVHADNVVVSGFQVLGDPQHAIQIRGNGINVANNMGATGPLTPAWQ